MGIVYSGVDSRLSRPVALKFLPPHLSGDPVAKQRFIQEARAASALNHPNICTIHEIGETDDEQLFIAMALYDGETLKSRLQRGPIPPDEAIRIAAQVADGLSAAHKKGILHRDIKPGNVMLTEHGETVILDFGLAKLSGAVELTAAGSTIGTAAYMSPEQMRGEEIGPASDIWSVGVMLYEMIAGTRPFSGEYEMALAYAILNQDPKPLTETSDVPDSLSEVVERSLAKRTQDRFPSVLDLRDALNFFLPGSEQFAALTDSSIRRQFGKVGAMKRLVLALSTVAGLVVAAILWTQFGALSGGSQLMAVLPFSVIGDAEEGSVYSAGLIETLTSKLSRLDLSAATLRVIPASEVSGSMTAGEARERLGATMVLTGSLQMDGNRIRLTMNLVDTKSREQLDSRLVDYDADSPLALQDQSVFLVAEMLRLELDPATRAGVTASSSEDRFANDLYLRAQGSLRQAQSIDDIETAISLFELAADRDSSFALAYAGLSEAYWRKYLRTDDVRWADRAIGLVDRAFELDAKSGHVLLVLGSIHDGRGDYDRALEAYEQVLATNPLDPEVYLLRGLTYRRQGSYDKSESDFRKAIALDPMYWRAYEYLGALYWRLGQYDRALAEWKRGLAIAPRNADLLANAGAAYWALEDAASAMASFESAIQSKPDHARARNNLGTAYFYQSRFENAAELYREKLRLTPKDFNVSGYLADTYRWIPGRSNEALQLYQSAIDLARERLTINPQDESLFASLAYYYAALGERDSSLMYLERGLKGRLPDSTEVQRAFGTGEVYVRLGMTDEAVPWLTSALDRGLNRIQLRHNPFLEDIRRDPRIRPYLSSK